ncbi:MAG TPA: hypothetical protein VF064_15545 [Pyrinomonadaceae bacterium]
MRFDIRTLMRTISALAIAALLLVGSLAPVMAQGRGRGRGRDNDRRHYGWERGRHRGWSHSARRGRMWRDDDNNNRRWRRRALLRRNRREARRDRWRDGRTFRRTTYRRDRRF